MPTVTLRLPDSHYRLFRKFAEEQNRSLSNFIETATIRHIEQAELANPFEMAEIKGNKEINVSLKRAHKDAQTKKGRFVE
ncbi:MAG: hypothetical protein JXA71_18640 [Chitinispirillaceae bacterium]|nr:hypothetical protein [Chitinispirillaceae bacterium]